MVARARVRSLASRADRVDVSQEVDADRLRQLVAWMRATMPDEPGEEAAQAAREARERLPARWSEPQGGIRFHAAQAACRRSDARHRVIEAGRRSGKSEDRKREIVIAALDPDWPGYAMGLRNRMIVVGAPTQDQTERLYLDDLRRMIPPDCLTSLRVSPRPEFRVVTGGVILLAGMDRPQRAEGFPIDDLYFDEFAEVKPAAWESHLSYSLSTPGRPPGRVTFYSTPDLDSGLHFVDLADQARELAADGDGSWSYHHWPSRGIVSDEEWEARRRTSDPAKFAVEFEARRVSTGLLAYHCWTDDHAVPRLRWVPDRAVSIGVDFNWDPGTATVTQEQVVEDYTDADELPDAIADQFTAVLDEVFLRRSNTPEVMREVLAVLEDRGHRGPVYVYGDASGGSGGSAKVQGSDIDLIRKVLGPALGNRLELRFKRRNPAVIARVQAVNARLQAADGYVRMVVDRRCRELVRDFQTVQRKGTRHFDLDKPTDGPGKLRTHLTDGLGYLIAAEYPAQDRASGETHLVA